MAPVGRGRALERAARCTVNLYPPGLPLASARRGSGVLLEMNDGGRRLATARHVAEFAGARNRLEVRFGDGARAIAEVTAAHEVHDAAVLRIVSADDDPAERDAAALAGPGVLAPDEPVIAAGIPMPWSLFAAFQPKASDDARLLPWQNAKYACGTVAALFCLDEDNDRGDQRLTHLLHTARVENGASGGPLLRSSDGALLGVHSCGDDPDHLAVSCAVIGELLDAGTLPWVPKGMAVVNRRAEEQGNEVLRLMYGPDTA